MATSFDCRKPSAGGNAMVASPYGRASDTDANDSSQILRAAPEDSRLTERPFGSAGETRHLRTFCAESRRRDYCLMGWSRVCGEIKQSPAIQPR